MTTRLEELQTMISDKLDILEERCYLLGQKAFRTREHRSDMLELRELIHDAEAEIMKMSLNERTGRNYVASIQIDDDGKRYIEYVRRTDVQ